MSGKVFISCGQRPPKERKIARKIEKLLKNKFGLDSYLAFKIQGLNDIMRIISELKSSDYYLIIDFFRNDKEGYSNSLFTHQELALAQHLGFTEMIALQQKGAPLEGFLKYVQSNPEIFENENDLLCKLEEMIKARKWNNKYSRNLIVSDIKRKGPIIYSDHTGSQTEYIWQLKVDNRRPDIAAKDVVCLLDYIIDPDHNKYPSYDRNFLKWAATHEYRRTILPEDSAMVDIFCLHEKEEGVFLHSTRDNAPRLPVIGTDCEEGNYIFHYKLFAENFPLVEFDVEIVYKYSSHSIPRPSKGGVDILTFRINWKNRTKAKIKWSD